MRIKVLTDWRKALIYVHRWLGIAGCLVFVVWFVSGIAMMYWGMPRLTAEERLSRMPALDLSKVALGPDEAARRNGIEARRVRLTMLDGRPVYRFLDHDWRTVFADTGDPFSGWSASDALRQAKSMFPELATQARYVRRIGPDDFSDLYLLQQGVRSQMPLHRIEFGDAAGTVVYVSDKTGEAAMKTDRWSRFRGFWSSILHWTYIPQLRRSGYWEDTIVWSAFIGGFLCLTGLVVGVWRTALTPRYRFRSGPSRSPYSGTMRWHHYAGLLFGLVTFTWAISGALSLGPFRSLRSAPPSRATRDAASGGPLNVGAVGLEPLREAATAMESAFSPREIEIIQFRGRPYLLAYRPPSLDDEPNWPTAGMGVTPYLSTALASLDHALVAIDDPDRGVFAHFSHEDMEAVARAAMPGVPVRDSVWMDSYDAHYYDRSGERSLPVLRIRYDDPRQTWLYLDPAFGTIPVRNDRAGRLNRWLYHGLHSLDFPFLYYRRPLWDIVVIGLSLGGIALCVTTILPACRRLGRRFRAAGQALRTRKRPAELATGRRAEHV